MEGIMLFYRMIYTDKCRLENNFPIPTDRYLLSIRPRPLFFTSPALFNSFDITSKIPLIN